VLTWEDWTITILALTGAEKNSIHLVKQVAVRVRVKFGYRGSEISDALSDVSLLSHFD
jgi:hypothetical protein